MLSHQQGFRRQDGKLNGLAIVMVLVGHSLCAVELYPAHECPSTTIYSSNLCAHPL